MSPECTCVVRGAVRNLFGFIETTYDIEGCPVHDVPTPERQNGSGQ